MLLFLFISLLTLSCTPLRILSKSSLRDSGTCARLEDALLSDGAWVVVIDGISPSPAIGGGGGGGGGMPAAGGGGGGG